MSADLCILFWIVSTGRPDVCTLDDLADEENDITDLELGAHRIRAKV